MKPRYKLIALWPYCDDTIGTIFTPYPIERRVQIICPEGPKGTIIPSDKNRCASAFYDQFPHLFKRLEWWEERKPEEMPEYAKPNPNGILEKLRNQKLVYKAEWIFDFEECWHKTGEWAQIHASHLLPATAADHQAFITKLVNQG